MTENTFDPIHPGDILKEDFLDAMGISARELARSIDVPANRVTEILNGKRRVTADTALLLSRYFNMSEGFWINLQSHYDLEVAKTANAAKLEAVKPRAMELA